MADMKLHTCTAALPRSNPIHSGTFSNFTVPVFAFPLLAILLSVLLCPQICAGVEPSSQATPSVVSTSTTTPANSLSEKIVSTTWPLLATIKAIHPLALGALLLLLVLGVCFLMTDNAELELYLKIEFTPPKTDILN